MDDIIEKLSLLLSLAGGSGLMGLLVDIFIRFDYLDFMRSLLVVSAVLVLSVLCSLCLSYFMKLEAFIFLRLSFVFPMVRASSESKYGLVYGLFGSSSLTI